MVRIHSRNLGQAHLNVFHNSLIVRSKLLGLVSLKVQHIHFSLRVRITREENKRYTKFQCPKMNENSIRTESYLFLRCIKHNHPRHKTNPQAHTPKDSDTSW